jgi:hypothetical protein
VTATDEVTAYIHNWFANRHPLAVETMRRFDGGRDVNETREVSVVIDQRCRVRIRALPGRPEAEVSFDDVDAAYEFAVRLGRAIDTATNGAPRQTKWLPPPDGLSVAVHPDGSKTVTMKGFDLEPETSTVPSTETWRDRPPLL